jgi:hypothetical protein
MTAVALVACRAAAADPSAGAFAPPAVAPPPIAPHVAAPPGWTALPAIAAAVATTAATDPAASSVAVDAWGEPAAGCYAIWLEIHGAAGDAPALAERVLVGLTGLTLGALVQPTAAEGELAFTFVRPPYRGRLRAQLGLGRIAATACFGNQREPLACDTACARVLQDVQVRAHVRDP